MSQTRERYFEITLLGLILITGAILFYQATPFINGILGAITLYILLRRVNIYCSKRLSPKAAPWVIVFAVTIFLMVPFSCAAWYIIDLFQTFNFDVQPLIDRVQRTLSSIEAKVGFDLVSEDSIKFMTAKVTGIAQMLMNGINNFAITLFTSLLLLFFLLSGSVKMERYIARLLPFNESNKHTIIKNITKIVRSNAIGIPLLAIIQGVIASICYGFIGVQNSVELGILTGFASLIPIVGTMLVWIPLAASQYFEAGLISCLWVIGCGICVISQCDNVLRMFMQKRMANTHPLITIGGVIVGLPLFGFMGLIFGPLLIAMFLLFLNMFAHQYLLGEDYHEEDEEEHNVKGTTLATPNLNDSNSHKNGNGSPSSTMGHSKGGNSHIKGSGKINSSSSRNNGKNPHQAYRQGAQGNSKQHILNNAINGTDSSDTAQSQELRGNATESSGLNRANTTSQDYSTARHDHSVAKSRPNLELVTPKKGSKAKKDFKSAKAEHKHQKREAAKQLAEQERQKQLQEAKSYDLVENLVSPKAIAQDKVTKIDQVTKSELVSRETSSQDSTSQDSSLEQPLLNHAYTDTDHTGLTDKSKEGSLQGNKTGALTTTHLDHLGEIEQGKALYNHNFSLAYDNLGQASSDHSQLKGKSLVSRAVAAALKPFADDQFLTEAHNKHDVELNADMISSESMQTTTNKQTSENQLAARSEGRRHTHNRPRRAEANANRAPRGRKDNAQENVTRRYSNKSAQYTGREESHNKASEQGSTIWERKANARGANRNQRGSKIGGSVKGGSIAKSGNALKNSSKSNSNKNSSTRTTSRGATHSSKGAYSDKAMRREESKSRQSRSRRSTNVAGYEILRPERKRSDDFPIIQTVVSHQYGSFDSKPRSSLRTQLVSVHTAKGTMVASNTRPHRSGKRRSSH